MEEEGNRTIIVECIAIPKFTAKSVFDRLNSGTK